MLMSMTGFGKTTGTYQRKKVTVEIRSVNSKSLDLNLRLPGIYRELEPALRDLVMKKLDRGKVDLFINIDSTGDSKSVTLNKDLAQLYYSDLKAVNELIDEKTPDYLALILRMPDIYINEREELDNEEKDWLLELTHDACNQLNEFRKQEGNVLDADFRERISEIMHLLSQIDPFEKERVALVRERIQKGLAELDNTKYDGNRLEQEMIFYIEKLDISEEKVRLKNHLDYFQETLNIPLCGKKLGFIAQEIGREINTLGSKSNHVAMQKLVVEMKDNLEKIKEQLLNTL